MHLTEVDFTNYYSQCSLSPSHWVLESLLRYDGPRNLAVDLGAGTLRDSFYLSREGFSSVLAVDASDRISMRTLWFLPFPDVSRVFAHAFAFIRPGGVFAFNILRQRTPSNPRNWFTMSETELSILTQKWSIQRIVPREIDQPLSGTECSVHWSTLDVLLRKP